CRRLRPSLSPFARKRHRPPALRCKRRDRTCEASESCSLRRRLRHGSRLRIGMQHHSYIAFKHNHLAVVEHFHAVAAQLAFLEKKVDRLAAYEMALLGLDSRLAQASALAVIGAEIDAAEN